MAWQSIFDQTNWGPDTTPSATANSITNVPGWTDKAGNWSVASTRIKSPAGGGFTEFLYRPENTRTNLRIIGRLEIDSGHRSFWLRLNPTTNDGYYCLFDPSTQGLTVSKLVGGVNNPLFSIDGASWGYNAAKTFEVDFNVMGTSPTTISLLIRNTTDNVTTYTMTPLTDSEASLQAAGRVGLSFFSGPSYFSRIAAFHDDPIAPATTYTLNAGATTVTSGGTVTYTVSLPADTTVASPVTITFSDNGGGGSFSSPTVQLTEASPTATSTYTAATSGTKTISTTNNGGLTNPASRTLTVNTANASQILQYNDAKLVRSPYNWSTRSAYLETNNSGAYLKIAFTATSIAMIQDLSHLIGASVPAGAYPTIKWSIDNGAIQTYQLTSADSSYTLATGLTNAAHTCQLWVDSFNFNLDRWATPVSSVRIQRFEVGTGGSFSQATELSNKAIFFGDSITEGIASTGAGNSATNTWAAALANTLNVEYAQIGFGFLGWTVATPAPSNVPAFGTSWNLQMSGANRTFTPAPDMVFVNMGTNDGLQSVASSTVQTAIGNWLTAARAAFGANTKIFLIVPFGQYQATATIAAFDAYKAANANDKIYLINLGAPGAVGLTGGGATLVSSDGVHPNTQGTIRLASMVAQAVQAKLGGSPPTTTTNLTQNVQRYGANITNAAIALAGSPFAAGNTTVFVLNTSGSYQSWQNGRASFLNTISSIPAYSAFQVLPGAAITTQDSQVSFGSAFTA